MPSSRAERFRFIVLCEDKNHYYFCQAYLKKVLGKRKVECHRSQIPAGSGSGEQWVRNTYPRERQALQQRPAGENQWLVVVIDGDKHTQQERRNQLPMQQDDKILRIIPSRNIETWFEWLTHGNVDEQTDYKHQHRKAKPGKHGEQMAEQCAQNDNTKFPPSLKAACDEWQRFKQIAS